MGLEATTKDVRSFFLIILKTTFLYLIKKQI